jgi:hypothetical protein
MSRTALTYLYLAIGWPLAMLFDMAAYHNAEERADTDNDGEAERNPGDIKHHEQRRLRRDEARARSPKAAAKYRADELFDRPLRTLGLLLLYEIPFLAVAVCVSYTDAVASLGGSSVGDVAVVVSDLVTPRVPSAIVPLLPALAVVAGLLFALVIHQSYKTSGDIQRHMVQ